MNTDHKGHFIAAIGLIVAAIIAGLFGLFQGKYSNNTETAEHERQQTTNGDKRPIVNTKDTTIENEMPPDTAIEKEKLPHLKIDRRPIPRYIGFYSDQHQPQTIYSWNSWDDTGSFLEMPLTDNSGDKFQRFTINTNSPWFGFGLETKVGTLNLKDFEKGRLHYAIRFPETMKILNMLEIGIQSRSSSVHNIKEVRSWLPTSAAKCQSCRNNWNCCTLEIKQFVEKADLDIGNISKMMMSRCKSIPASNSRDPVYLDVDEIYWSTP